MVSASPLPDQENELEAPTMFQASGQFPVTIRSLSPPISIAGDGRRLKVGRLADGSLAIVIIVSHDGEGDARQLVCERDSDEPEGLRVDQPLGPDT